MWAKYGPGSGGGEVKTFTSSSRDLYSHVTYRIAPKNHPSTYLSTPLLVPYPSVYNDDVRLDETLPALNAAVGCVESGVLTR